MTTWTKQDEIRYKELAERRARWEEESRAPIWALAVQLNKALEPGYDTGGLCDWLMGNAAELRDALLPYDDRVNS